MKVDGYYEGGNDYSNQVGISAFVSAIAGGFGGLNGGTEAQQATYNAFDNAYGGIGMMGTDSINVPAAYLNYMLFDKNMSMYQHGHTQITSEADWQHAKMSIDDIEVSQIGFVYVYLTNESASLNPVYFDDFEVTLTEFGVVQSDDYYPFGLTFNHYQQVSGKENKYLYQGKEKIADTDWYDFHARGYSPTLGRFMQIDPHYNGPSGYVGMLNNPMGNVDPSGEDPVTISLTAAIIISAAVSAVSYTASIALSPGGFNNWDWGAFAKNMVVGTVSGVASWGVGQAFVGIIEVSKASPFLIELSRAVSHATVQGTITGFTGGDAGSAMLSGFAGSLVGSYGIHKEWGNAETILSSMLMGGAGAELGGGDFWQGAAVGGIVAGANGIAHRLALSWEAKIAENKEKQKIEKVNLSAAPDEVFNELVNKYDELFAGFELNKPNDGREKNYYNINDIVTNPPDYHTGSTSAKLTSPELFTKAGVKFRWAISPPDFQNVANYDKGYLYSIQTNAGSKIAQIHFIGSDNHAVLTLTIYGRANFKPILEKIYNGTRDF